MKAKTLPPAGLSYWTLTRNIGICKAFPIRFDDTGPLPTEIEDPEQDHIREMAHEFRHVPVKALRVGYQDLVSLKNFHTTGRSVILRLKTGKPLILCASSRPKMALAHYRKRWRIEPLFSRLKKRGLGLEDTHMTNLEKLSTLLAALVY